MSRSDLSDPAWSRPPPPLEGDSELYVDFRFTVKALSDINTVNGTADVQFDVTMYWTDSRLANWSESLNLPSKLWTPRFNWYNTVQHQSEFMAPTILGLKRKHLGNKGRLRLRQSLSGTMKNPMDLHAFPFNVDDVAIGLRTGIHSRLADGTMESVCNSGRLYCVRKIKDPNEGSWLNVGQFPGRVSEWTLHGMSTEIDDQAANSQGQEKTEVILSFHLARGVAYYFWKALFPLYLLTMLSFTTFEFEVSDLQSRNDTVATYFLAAFAMLYVVGESLPKTDFLTRIDKVIVLTISCLVTIGITSVVLHRQSNTDLDRAEEWNTWIQIALASTYVLINMIIFIPAAIQSYREVWLLQAEETSEGALAGFSTAKLQRPTVKKNAEYFRWMDLKLGHPEIHTH